MASFTTTTHDKFIPEVWSKEAQLARESRLYMANKVDRFDVEFAGGGDLLHIPKVANLTAGDIGNDGSLTDTAPTETEATITINKWKGLSINVPDILKAQSKLDLMKIYTEKIGFALAVAVEDDLLTLYDGLSQNVGTASVDITDATFRSAVQKLDEANAPFEDRYLIIKPSQKNALLGIDKFVRYDAVARSAGDSPIVKGLMGEIYGVQIMVSTRVETNSATENIMWHKSAFGLAMVKDVKMEQFARTQFSDRMGSSELYGFAELRDDHAVQVRS